MKWTARRQKSIKTTRNSPLNASPFWVNRTEHLRYQRMSAQLGLRSSSYEPFYTHVECTGLVDVVSAEWVVAAVGIIDADFMGRSPSGPHGQKVVGVMPQVAPQEFCVLTYRLLHSVITNVLLCN